jgi:hypothetical protein
MRHHTGRRRVARRLAAMALVLAGLGAPAAVAGGRAVIVLTPPQPVLPSPAPVIPPLALPGSPAPFEPLPPQVTFTPPRAVPFIVPAGRR